MSSQAVPDQRATHIINLYAGPGAGKSTSAAFLFAFLKAAGVNAELVREYVKNWAWEGRKISVYDQFYFLGKQIRAESLLFGKVNWIVTDSPVLLSVLYAEKFCPPKVADAVREAVRGYYEQAKKDRYIHHHIFLQRSKQYNPAGRFQTEEEAKQLDRELFDLMWDETMVEPRICQTDATALKSLLIDLQAITPQQQAPAIE